MMRGRLVIASDIGGLGEVVGDAGLKFPAGGASRLADQMKKVIQSAEEVATLGKLAQDRALISVPRRPHGRRTYSHIPPNCLSCFYLPSLVN
jgi:glycosyltransferase involved in cell wall biosynthesis